jgi:citronellol/citronellal dehydrogenase
MADAAHVILSRDAGSCTGNFFIDDEVLKSAGVTDLDCYAVTPDCNADRRIADDGNGRV